MPDECILIIKRIYLHREKRKTEMFLGNFVYNFSQVVLLTEGLSSRAALLLELNTSLEAFTDKLR